MVKSSLRADGSSGFQWVFSVEYELVVALQQADQHLGHDAPADRSEAQPVGTGRRPCFAQHVVPERRRRQELAVAAASRISAPGPAVARRSAPARPSSLPRHDRPATSSAAAAIEVQQPRAACPLGGTWRNERGQVRGRSACSGSGTRRRHREEAFSHRSQVRGAGAALPLSVSDAWRLARRESKTETAPVDRRRSRSCRGPCCARSDTPRRRTPPACTALSFHLKNWRFTVGARAGRARGQAPIRHRPCRRPSAGSRASTIHW